MVVTVREAFKDERLALHADAVVQAADAAGIALIVVLFELPDLPIQFVNKALADLLGYEPEELIGLPALSFAAEEQALALMQMVEARMRGDDVPFHVETACLRKDGAVVPVEVSMSFVEVAERMLSVSFVADLSVRRDAQAALRRSEDQFKRVIESAPEAIWIIDRERVHYANPAAAALFGYERAEQVRGADPRIFTQHEDLAVFEKRVHALLCDRERLPAHEYQLRRRDGRAMSVEVSSIAIDYEGAPAILSFARDVTERKQIEAQLLQADRLATLGMLAGGMAHAINNPLAYVMLDLEHLAETLPRLAAEPWLLAEATTRLREAHQGAERMAQVVRRMRTFSRVDDRTRGPVDLLSVLEAAVDMVGNEIRHRGTLTTDYSDVPPVFGNPARLEQIFLNLLVYAAQSLPETNDPPGEVRLSVAPDGASRLLVEVVCTTTRDVDAALNDPARISLAVCRSIVSSLGGEMRFESERHGTKFRVWLPAAGATWSDPPPSSSVEPPPASGIRARVLVVDDDPGVGNALRVILEEEHSVTCVASAAAALELFRGGMVFDVVFCDLMMPEEGGPELYERLRGEHPGLERSLVFMTGGAYTAQAVEFLARVPNARIEKPFDLRALRRLVQRAAARRWVT